MRALSAGVSLAARASPWSVASRVSAAIFCSAMTLLLVGALARMVWGVRQQAEPTRRGATASAAQAIAFWLL
jgi:hypothetical protein